MFLCIGFPEHVAVFPQLCQHHCGMEPGEECDGDQGDEEGDQGGLGGEGPEEDAEGQGDPLDDDPGEEPVKLYLVRGRRHLGR